MRRTTASLPEDLAQALEREARRRRASVSEITCAALAQHLGLADQPRELPFAGLGRSGRSTTARDMEQPLEAERSELARDR